LQFVGLEQDHDADADADVHVDLDHDVSVDHDLDMDHDLDLDHDVSVEHDLDVDQDADLDHDLDQDVDHDLDHDVDHDIEHDVSHDAGGAPAWTGILQSLGVGQAPLTMILLVLLGGFGIIGWIANALILSVSPTYLSFSGLPIQMRGWFSGLMFAVVVGVDLGIGWWFTKHAAVFLGRAVPAFSSTATSVKRLVSRRGRVISPQVDEKYGQVKVRDPGGTLITVFAVVDPGKPPIPRDTEVILVEYDEPRKMYIVVPSDL
jgi:hypothetical protein